jgi:hypothetical protein
MMIDPTLAAGRSVGATRKSEKARRRNGVFARALEADGNEPLVAAAEAQASAVGAIDVLLSAQELSSDPEARGQAKTRGEQLLDQLDDLRCSLLAGRIPLARLEALVTSVKAARLIPSDAKLAETLDEIELLARVELAKLGQDV